MTALRQAIVLITGFIFQFFGSIKYRGPGIIWLALKESLWFDWRYGVDTFLPSPKRYQLQRSLRFSSWRDMLEFKDAMEYTPVLTSVMRQTLDIIRASVGQQQFASMQFVDLGCGKGKPLLVFHLSCREFNQRRMVGIDYDTTLIDVCGDNMMRLKIPSSTYRLVCDFASTSLRYLDDPPFCVYICGSFHGYTLQLTLDSLASVPHVLCYIDPPALSAFEKLGYTPIYQREGHYGVDSWLILSKNLCTVEYKEPIYAGFTKSRVLKLYGSG